MLLLIITFLHSTRSSVLWQHNIDTDVSRLSTVVSSSS
jgi:hypothetical protein